MLVCPQCQFENPDPNKFCQQCGTSLTYKVCPECRTQVAYSAKQCHNCGTFTGTVLRAIVSPIPGVISSSPPTGDVKKPNIDLSESLLSGKLDIEAPSAAVNTPNHKQRLPASENELPTTAAITEGNTPQLQDLREEEAPSLTINVDPSEFENSDTANTLLPEQPIVAYLDPQQRYQLLEPLPPVEMGEVEVLVLDSSPLQASPLEVLQNHQTKGIGIQQDSAPIPTANINQSIPPIANAYLAIKSKFNSVVPKVHDAWVTDTQQVLLLEDRSQWPHLLDLWRDNQISEMHLLHILHSMASLWVALESWNCRQSLVDMSNLRVDEDQSLALLRLHADSPNAIPTVQILGQVWKELFQQSERTLFGPIGILLSELKQETIQTTNELRSRLQEIANEFQTESNQSSPVSTVDSPNNPTIAPPSIAPSFLKEQMNPYPSTGAEGDDMPTVVLPMQLLSLEDAGRTDVGRQRRHNEDYFGVQTALTKLESPLGRNIQARGLYILCDGMGGHAGGEVASALAVKTLTEYFQAHWREELPDDDCIRKGIIQANQVIFDINQQDARSGSGRMGTTLVMVLVQETQVAVAHVGDSRLYRLSRRQSIEQVTVDHEVGQREIKRGVEPEIAYSRPDSYQLTQALGPRNEHFIDPDIQFFELTEDTLLLLCSDGLSDNDLIENHWQTHLQPLLSSRSSLEQGVSELIELANQYNGHDNITAILIRAKVRPDLEQARVANG